MKILMKKHIIKSKQIGHVRNENEIISMLQHPFVVNLVAAFSDDFNLYLVMEFVNGGELYSLLQNRGKLSNEHARMYVGEVALAFYYFSQLNIVYRDLKPENLLIDSAGHMKITDFGLAKIVTDRTRTMCGTPDYLAPEIIQNKGHSFGVDYWALGVVCFEMLTGLPPFYVPEGGNRTLQLILKSKPQFPAGFPPEAKDFVMKLMEHNVPKRLGCRNDGVQEILMHPWFAGTDWPAMANGTAPTHWQPPSTGEDDTSNFDDYDAYNPAANQMRLTATVRCRA
jgi:protein kinase X